jgi:hypothetical protein
MRIRLQFMMYHVITHFTAKNCSTAFEILSTESGSFFSSGKRLGLMTTWCTPSAEVTLQTEFLNLELVSSIAQQYYNRTHLFIALFVQFLRRLEVPFPMRLATDCIVEGRQFFDMRMEMDLLEVNTCCDNESSNG